MKDNIIKLTCKELGLTYKQLADEIGYSESAVKNGAVGKASEPMEFAIKQMYKIKELENKLEATNAFKQNLKDFLKD